MTNEEKVTTPVEGEIVEETTTQTPAAAPASSTPDYLAIASLVLGILTLCAWLIPICGCTLSIVGIVLGAFGLKSTKYKNLAIIGIVLSSLGLIGSLVNWGIGTAYYMQHPEQNPLNNL